MLTTNPATSNHGHKVTHQTVKQTRHVRSSIHHTITDYQVGIPRHYLVGTAPLPAKYSGIPQPVIGNGISNNSAAISRRNTLHVNVIKSLSQRPTCAICNFHAKFIASVPITNTPGSRKSFVPATTNVVQQAERMQFEFIAQGMQK